MVATPTHYYDVMYATMVAPPSHYYDVIYAIMVAPPTHCYDKSHLLINCNVEIKIKLCVNITLSNLVTSIPKVFTK